MKEFVELVNKKIINETVDSFVATAEKSLQPGKPSIVDWFKTNIPSKFKKSLEQGLPNVNREELIDKDFSNILMRTKQNNQIACSTKNNVVGFYMKIINPISLKIANDLGITEEDKIKNIKKIVLSVIIENDMVSAQNKFSNLLIFPQKGSEWEKELMAGSTENAFENYRQELEKIIGISA